MSERYKDRKYLSIVNDILEHQEFQKTKDIVHHGMNRYDHSVRVSYYSYKITNFLKLSSEETARGALLHDFFFDDNEKIGYNKERAEVLVNHPKYALQNANKYFSISDKEANIIVSHMFPVAPTVPRYLESWIVDFVDDIVSIYERVFSLSKELSAAMSFLMIISINVLR